MKHCQFYSLISGTKRFKAIPGFLNIKTLSLFEIIRLLLWTCAIYFWTHEKWISLWSERRRDIIGRNGRFGCYGGLGMCFFYNLVTVSLPIHMNNHVLINFIESPWIMLINTSWKHLAPGGGGRGGPQQIILRGGSAPRSNPLQFYLPFWQNQSINQSFILTRYVEELENSFKIRTCKKKSIPWCKCIPFEI